MFIYINTFIYTYYTIYIHCTYMCMNIIYTVIISDIQFMQHIFAYIGYHLRYHISGILPLPVMPYGALAIDPFLSVMGLCRTYQYDNPWVTRSLLGAPVRTMRSMVPTADKVPKRDNRQGKLIYRSLSNTLILYICIHTYYYIYLLQ